MVVRILLGCVCCDTPMSVKKTAVRGRAKRDDSPHAPCLYHAQCLCESTYAKYDGCRRNPFKGTRKFRLRKRNESKSPVGPRRDGGARWRRAIFPSPFFSRAVHHAFMSSSSYSSTSSWISTRNSADSPSGYDFIASVSTLSFAGPVRRLQSLYDEWRQLWSSDNPNAEKIWQSVEFNSVHRSVTKFLGDTDLDDKLSPTEDTTSVCLRSLFHFYCDFVSENDGLFCEAGWDILMNTLLGMRAISSHYHLLETIPDATDLLKNTPKLWLTLWKHRCAMVAYSYEDNGREYSFMWLLTDTVLGVANLIFHCGGIPPWGSTDF
ncbi:hypothetical protein OF83DRAFT_916238 [Amylostereum chailletii]|nr:hypothetical protein OF83DRAFT_916238 [Amylostereum chailletii]